jgi:F-type H+-transporting ATPase subunit a
VLSPFIVLVETVSILIRPLTLSVRLVANILAGHLILTIIGEGMRWATFCLGGFTLITAILVLEIAVAFIQGYVLIILCTLYLIEVFMFS